MDSSGRGDPRQRRHSVDEQKHQPSTKQKHRAGVSEQERREAQKTVIRRDDESKRPAFAAPAAENVTDDTTSGPEHCAPPPPTERFESSPEAPPHPVIHVTSPTRAVSELGVQDNIHHITHGTRQSDEHSHAGLGLSPQTTGSSFTSTLGGLDTSRHFRAVTEASLHGRSGRSGRSTASSPPSLASPQFLTPAPTEPGIATAAAQQSYEISSLSDEERDMELLRVNPRRVRALYSPERGLGSAGATQSQGEIPPAQDQTATALQSFHHEASELQPISPRLEGESLDLHVPGVQTAMSLPEQAQMHATSSTSISHPGSLLSAAMQDTDHTNHEPLRPEPEAKRKPTWTKPMIEIASTPPQHRLDLTTLPFLPSSPPMLPQYPTQFPPPPPHPPRDASTVSSGTPSQPGRTGLSTPRSRRSKTGSVVGGRRVPLMLTVEGMAAALAVTHEADPTFEKSAAEVLGVPVELVRQVAMGESSPESMTPLPSPRALISASPLGGPSLGMSPIVASSPKNLMQTLRRSGSQSKLLVTPPPSSGYHGPQRPSAANLIEDSHSTLLPSLSNVDTSLMCNRHQIEWKNALAMLERYTEPREDEKLRSSQGKVDSTTLELTSLSPLSLGLKGESLERVTLAPGIKLESPARSRVETTEARTDVPVALTANAKKRDYNIWAEELEAEEREHTISVILLTRPCLIDDYFDPSFPFRHIVQAPKLSSDALSQSQDHMGMIDAAIRRLGAKFERVLATLDEPYEDDIELSVSHMGVDHPHASSPAHSVLRDLHHWLHCPSEPSMASNTVISALDSEAEIEHVLQSLITSVTAPGLDRTWLNPTTMHNDLASLGKALGEREASLVQESGPMHACETAASTSDAMLPPENVTGDVVQRMRLGFEKACVNALSQQVHEQIVRLRSRLIGHLSRTILGDELAEFILGNKIVSKDFRLGPGFGLPRPLASSVEACWMLVLLTLLTALGPSCIHHLERSAFFRMDSFKTIVVEITSAAIGHWQNTALLRDRKTACQMALRKEVKSLMMNKVRDFITSCVTAAAFGALRYGSEALALPFMLLSTPATANLNFVAYRQLAEELALASEKDSREESGAVVRPLSASQYSTSGLGYNASILTHFFESTAGASNYSKLREGLPDPDNADSFSSLQAPLESTLSRASLYQAAVLMAAAGSGVHPPPFLIDRCSSGHEDAASNDGNRREIKVPLPMSSSACAYPLTYRLRTALLATVLAPNLADLSTNLIAGAPTTLSHWQGVRDLTLSTEGYLLRSFTQAAWITRLRSVSSKLGCDLGALPNLGPDDLVESVGGGSNKESHSEAPDKVGTARDCDLGEVELDETNFERSLAHLAVAPVEPIEIRIDSTQTTSIDFSSKEANAVIADSVRRLRAKAAVAHLVGVGGVLSFDSNKIMFGLPTDYQSDQCGIGKFTLLRSIPASQAEFGLNSALFETRQASEDASRSSAKESMNVFDFAQGLQPSSENNNLTPISQSCDTEALVSSRSGSLSRSSSSRYPFGMKHSRTLRELESLLKSIKHESHHCSACKFLRRQSVLPAPLQFPARPRDRQISEENGGEDAEFYIGETPERSHTFRAIPSRGYDSPTLDAKSETPSQVGRRLRLTVDVTRPKPAPQRFDRISDEAQPSPVDLSPNIAPLTTPLPSRRTKPATPTAELVPSERQNEPAIKLLQSECSQGCTAGPPEPGVSASQEQTTVSLSPSSLVPPETQRDSEPQREHDQQPPSHSGSRIAALLESLEKTPPSKAIAERVDAAAAVACTFVTARIQKLRDLRAPTATAEEKSALHLFEKLWKALKEAGQAHIAGDQATARECLKSAVSISSRAAEAIQRLTVQRFLHLIQSECEIFINQRNGAPWSLQDGPCALFNSQHVSSYKMDYGTESRVHYRRPKHEREVLFRQSDAYFLEKCMVVYCYDERTGIPHCDATISRLQQQKRQLPGVETHQESLFMLREGVIPLASRRMWQVSPAIHRSDANYLEFNLGLPGPSVGTLLKPDVRITSQDSAEVRTREQTIEEIEPGGFDGLSWGAAVHVGAASSIACGLRWLQTNTKSIPLYMRFLQAGRRLNYVAHLLRSRGVQAATSRVEPRKQDSPPPNSGEASSAGPEEEYDQETSARTKLEREIGVESDFIPASLDAAFEAVEGAAASGPGTSEAVKSELAKVLERSLHDPSLNVVSKWNRAEFGIAKASEIEIASGKLDSIQHTMLMQRMHLVTMADAANNPCSQLPGGLENSVQDVVRVEELRRLVLERSEDADATALWRTGIHSQRQGTLAMKLAEQFRKAYARSGLSKILPPPNAAARAVCTVAASRAATLTMLPLLNATFPASMRRFTFEHLRAVALAMKHGTPSCHKALALYILRSKHAETTAMAADLALFAGQRDDHDRVDSQSSSDHDGWPWQGGILRKKSSHDFQAWMKLRRHHAKEESLEKFKCVVCPRLSSHEFVNLVNDPNMTLAVQPYPLLPRKSMTFSSESTRLWGFLQLGRALESGETIIPPLILPPSRHLPPFHRCEFGSAAWFAHYGIPAGLPPLPASLFYGSQNPDELLSTGGKGEGNSSGDGAIPTTRSERTISDGSPTSSEHLLAWMQVALAPGWGITSRELALLLANQMIALGFLRCQIPSKIFSSSPGPHPPLTDSMHPKTSRFVYILPKCVNYLEQSTIGSQGHDKAIPMLKMSDLSPPVASPEDVLCVSAFKYDAKTRSLFSSVIPSRGSALIYVVSPAVNVLNQPPHKAGVSFDSERFLRTKGCIFRTHPTFRQDPYYPELAIAPMAGTSYRQEVDEHAIDLASYSNPWPITAIHPPILLEPCSGAACCTCEQTSSIAPLENCMQCSRCVEGIDSDAGRALLNAAHLRVNFGIISLCQDAIYSYEIPKPILSLTLHMQPQPAPASLTPQNRSRVQGTPIASERVAATPTSLPSFSVPQCRLVDGSGDVDLTLVCSSPSLLKFYLPQYAPASTQAQLPPRTQPLPNEVNDLTSNRSGDVDQGTSDGTNQFLKKSSECQIRPDSVSCVSDSQLATLVQSSLGIAPDRPEFIGKDRYERIALSPLESLLELSWLCVVYGSELYAMLRDAYIQHYVDLYLKDEAYVYSLGQGLPSPRSDHAFSIPSERGTAFLSSPGSARSRRVQATEASRVGHTSEPAPSLDLTRRALPSEPMPMLQETALQPSSIELTSTKFSSERLSDTNSPLFLLESEARSKTSWNDMHTPTEPASFEASEPPRPRIDARENETQRLKGAAEVMDSGCPSASMVSGTQLTSSVAAEFEDENNRPPVQKQERSIPVLASAQSVSIKVPQPMPKGGDHLLPQIPEVESKPMKQPIDSDWEPTAYPDLSPPSREHDATNEDLIVARSVLARGGTYVQSKFSIPGQPPQTESDVQFTPVPLAFPGDGEVTETKRQAPEEEFPTLSGKPIVVDMEEAVRQAHLLAQQQQQASHSTSQSPSPRQDSKSRSQSPDDVALPLAKRVSYGSPSSKRDPQVQSLLESQRVRSENGDLKQNFVLGQDAAASGDRYIHLRASESVPSAIVTDDDEGADSDIRRHRLPSPRLLPVRTEEIQDTSPLSDTDDLFAECCDRTEAHIQATIQRAHELAKNRWEVWSTLWTNSATGFSFTSPHQDQGPSTAEDADAGDYCLPQAPFSLPYFGAAKVLFPDAYARFKKATEALAHALEGLLPVLDLSGVTEEGASNLADIAGGYDSSACPSDTALRPQTKSVTVNLAQLLAMMEHGLNIRTDMLIRPVGGATSTTASIVTSIPMDSGPASHMQRAVMLQARRVIHGVGLRILRALLLNCYNAMVMHMLVEAPLHMHTLPRSPPSYLRYIYASPTHLEKSWPQSPQGEVAALPQIPISAWWFLGGGPSTADEFMTLERTHGWMIAGKVYTALDLRLSILARAGALCSEFIIAEAQNRSKKRLTELQSFQETVRARIMAEERSQSKESETSSLHATKIERLHALSDRLRVAMAQLEDSVRGATPCLPAASESFPLLLHHFPEAGHPGLPIPWRIRATLTSLFLSDVVSNTLFRAEELNNGESRSVSSIDASLHAKLDDLYDRIDLLGDAYESCCPDHHARAIEASPSLRRLLMDGASSALPPGVSLATIPIPIRNDPAAVTGNAVSPGVFAERRKTLGIDTKVEVKDSSDQSRWEDIVDQIINLDRPVSWYESDEGDSPESLMERVILSDQIIELRQRLRPFISSSLPIPLYPPLAQSLTLPFLVQASRTQPPPASAECHKVMAGRSPREMDIFGGVLPIYLLPAASYVRAITKMAVLEGIKLRRKLVTSMIHIRRHRSPPSQPPSENPSAEFQVSSQTDSGSVASRERVLGTRGRSQGKRSFWQRRVEVLKAEKSLGPATGQSKGQPRGRDKSQPEAYAIRAANFKRGTSTKLRYGFADMVASALVNADGGAECSIESGVYAHALFRNAYPRPAIADNAGSSLFEFPRRSGGSSAFDDRSGVPTISSGSLYVSEGSQTSNGSRSRPAQASPKVGSIYSGRYSEQTRSMIRVWIHMQTQGREQFISATTTPAFTSRVPKAPSSAMISRFSGLRSGMPPLDTPERKLTRQGPFFSTSFIGRGSDATSFSPLTLGVTANRPQHSIHLISQPSSPHDTAALLEMGKIALSPRLEKLNTSQLYVLDVPIPPIVMPALRVLCGEYLRALRSFWPEAHAILSNHQMHMELSSELSFTKPRMNVSAFPLYRRAILLERAVEEEMRAFLRSKVSPGLFPQESRTDRSKGPSGLTLSPHGMRAFKRQERRTIASSFPYAHVPESAQMAHSLSTKLKPSPEIRSDFPTPSESSENKPSGRNDANASKATKSQAVGSTKTMETQSHQDRHIDKLEAKLLEHAANTGTRLLQCPPVLVLLPPWPPSPPEGLQNVTAIRADTISSATSTSPLGQVASAGEFRGGRSMSDTSHFRLGSDQQSESDSRGEDSVIAISTTPSELQKGKLLQSFLFTDAQMAASVFMHSPEHLLAIVRGYVSCAFQRPADNAQFTSCPALFKVGKTLAASYNIFDLPQYSAQSLYQPSLSTVGRIEGGLSIPTARGSGPVLRVYTNRSLYSELILGVARLCLAPHCTILDLRSHQSTYAALRLGGRGAVKPQTMTESLNAHRSGLSLELESRTVATWGNPCLALTSSIFAQSFGHAPLTIRPGFNIDVHPSSNALPTSRHGIFAPHHPMLRASHRRSSLLEIAEKQSALTSWHANLDLQAYARVHGIDVHALDYKLGSSGESFWRHLRHTVCPVLPLKYFPRVALGSFLNFLHKFMNPRRGEDIMFITRRLHVYSDDGGMNVSEETVPIGDVEDDTISGNQLLDSIASRLRQQRENEDNLRFLAVIGQEFEADRSDLVAEVMTDFNSGLNDTLLQSYLSSFAETDVVTDFLEATHGRGSEAIGKLIRASDEVMFTNETLEHLERKCHDILSTTQTSGAPHGASRDDASDGSSESDEGEADTTIEEGDEEDADELDGDELKLLRLEEDAEGAVADFETHLDQLLSDTTVKVIGTELASHYVEEEPLSPTDDLPPMTASVVQPQQEPQQPGEHHAVDRMEETKDPHGSGEATHLQTRIDTDYHEKTYFVAGGIGALTEKGKRAELRAIAESKRALKQLLKKLRRFRETSTLKAIFLGPSAWTPASPGAALQQFASAADQIRLALVRSNAIAAKASQTSATLPKGSRRRKSKF